MCHVTKYITCTDEEKKAHKGNNTPTEQRATNVIPCYKSFHIYKYHSHTKSKLFTRLTALDNKLYQSKNKKRREDIRIHYKFQDALYHQN